MFNNINGYQSKSESVFEILSEIEPEIVALCETKSAQKNTLKRDFKNYELVTKQIKKGKGGILCGVKKNIGTSSVLEVTTVKNDNILTVKISFPKYSIRVVVAYGPQENESVESKDYFFKDLTIEVEACKVNGDHLMLMGDLNSKIEWVNGGISSLSNNGKYLEDIVTKYNLKVLNFSDTCVGKWTHVVRRNNQKSVLDYVIVDDQFNSAVRDFLIDEECLYTPFRRVTENNTVRAQYSDHNTIITKIEMGKNQKESRCTENESDHGTWLLNDDGWKKFFEITNKVPCKVNLNGDSNEEYNKLEKYIKDTMDCSFKKSARKKVKVMSAGKEENSIVKILRKFMKQGKLQRKVASVYVNMIKENNLNIAGQRRIEKVKNVLQELSHNDKLSPNAFWKLKKSLDLKTEVGTSIVLQSGVEVYGESAIKEAYKDEFRYRLRTRTINEDLQSYENLTNALCKLYGEVGSTQSNMKFTTSNLARVIKTLSKKKAPGPDGLPAEVFIHAGRELISSITEIFNNIKVTSSIPKKWNKVNIKTLYKNKGSQKDLENWRGVFLTPTISKLFERYMMTESKEKVENISKFQGGSRPNRSASDQLFLLRASTDHAKYMRKCIYLLLYDFKQCFDSMWLEDSIISLRKIGIQEDILMLIKRLNETSEITVKTPVGNTSEFKVENIVKQGTVLGPLLCSASTAECCEEHKQGGVSIGATSIRSLAYVDDIVDLIESEEDAIEAHNTVTKFTSKKRLELSWKKCSIIPINTTKKNKIPVLKIDGKTVKTEQSAKYLGDIINNKGTNCDMIDDRVQRGNACMVNSLSMVQDLTFGCRTIETTLLLYNSLFLATVLFNSQSWSCLNKKDLEKLKVCQMSYLKRTLKAPRSAANAIVLLELGLLPIEFEIYSRKLMFLHHIVTLDPSDPVKIVYQEQMKYESEKNWANEVKLIKEQINLVIDDEDICATSKSRWKSQVGRAIKEAAINKLNCECKRLKKVTRQYTKLETQEYLLRLPVDDARTAFAYRSGTLDIKCHRHYMYEDLVCRACGEGEENVNHIVNICDQTNCEILDVESKNLDVVIDIVKKIKSHSAKVTGKD